MRHENAGRKNVGVENKAQACGSQRVDIQRNESLPVGSNGEALRGFGNFGTTFFDVATLPVRYE